MKTMTIQFPDLHKTAMAILLIAGMLFAGCTKDEEVTPDAKPAPELPPLSSFAIDFNDFADPDTTAYKSNLTYQHWWRAATHVAVWNTVLTVTLVVPVAAFFESFNHQAIYDPNADNWVWSYNFNAGGALHLAELKASLIPGGVKWEMYISKNNAYSDFLWFSGVADFDNNEGYWELNQNPQNPNEFIYIDWNRDDDNGTADIKYTNVVPGNAGNGSYIYYGIDESLDLDAFYNIYGMAEDNLVNIQWSKSLKYGKIKDEPFFNDPEWQCWDETLQDDICP